MTTISPHPLGPRPGRAARLPGLVGVLGTGLLLAACSSAASTSPRSTSSLGSTTATGPPTNTHLPPTSTEAPPTSSGKPPTSTEPPPTSTKPPPSPALVPLPEPAPLQPFAANPLRGEGMWQPAGRLVDGHPAVYETMLQQPGSSIEAGIAWMDTRLLRAQLYSGSRGPGPGPWKFTAPILPAAARKLVAVFNGGFQFPSAEGGYYSEGRLYYPLRAGGASLVIYRNGNVTVGQWGRDVTMTPQVVSVRQNLTLLVDGGQPVPVLNPNDTYAWGSSLGGIPNQWRVGLGERADGSLVFVAGPSLEITQLAALLVRAGSVRAMTLDMNPEWTVFVTYDPQTPGGLASPSNGRRLVASMAQGPYTFFEASWSRDFITMSAR